MRVFIYELISAGGLGATIPASLRREGAAMLQAIVTDFQRVAGVDVLTLLADDFSESLGARCRRVAAAEEAPAFGELAAAADAALIIAPEFDDLLATRSQWALDAGCRLLGSSPAAVRLAGDKLRLAEHFQERCLPTPTTSLVETALTGAIGLPCVCKPRHGAGSQATFVVRQGADLLDALPKARAEAVRDDLLIQPLFPGQAASVAIIKGPGGSIVTPGATQRLSDDGRLRYLGGSVPLAPDLRGRAVSLAQRAVQLIPGLQGYVGVDVILGDADDGSRDVVIEINPRLTTSYIGLRRLARSNLAEVWLRLWRDEAVDPVAWDEGVIDFTADGRTSLAVSRSQ
jgi:predicted ATP-grasp superfamily ATP-dependent carboligase